MERYKSVWKDNFADETNTRLYDLKSVHNPLDTIGQNYIDFFASCIKLDDVMLVFGLDDSLSKAALWTGDKIAWLGDNNLPDSLNFKHLLLLGWIWTLI